MKDPRTNRFAEPTSRAEWDIDGSGRMTDKQRIAAQLDYCPETGLFRWKINGRGRSKRINTIAGTPHSNGYVRIKLMGRAYYAHRLAWLLMHGTWPADQIDHVNGDRSDNRAANLRQATLQQNRWNTVGIPSRRKSAFKGVVREHRSTKWVAQLSVDGRLRRLGSFATEEEASSAYLRAARTLRGEFAK